MGVPGLSGVVDSLAMLTGALLALASSFCGPGRAKDRVGRSAQVFIFLTCVFSSKSEVKESTGATDPWGILVNWKSAIPVPADWVYPHKSSVLGVLIRKA